MIKFFNKLEKNKKYYKNSEKIDECGSSRAGCCYENVYIIENAYNKKSGAFFNSLSNQYVIAGNDQFGIYPPSYGTAAPKLPNNVIFYANEFNSAAKLDFLEGCKRNGFQIYDVTPELADISQSLRVSRLNKSNANVCITFGTNLNNINFNEIRGIEVRYSKNNPYQNESEHLAQLCYNELIKVNNFSPAGIVDYNSIILSDVKMPSITCMCGYMSNLLELGWLMDPDYQRQCAEACVRAICNFFNINYVEFIPNYVRKPIRKGDINQDVQYLQKKLRSKLYYTGMITGNYDDLLQKAVIDFQKDFNINPTGMVDSNTWIRIYPIGGGKIGNNEFAPIKESILISSEEPTYPSENRPH